MQTDREDVDTELLISFIEDKPEIWDKSIEEYKDRIKTREAWISVCCQLKPDFQDLSDGERKEFGKFTIIHIFLY